MISPTPRGTEERTASSGASGEIAARPRRFTLAGLESSTVLLIVMGVIILTFWFLLRDTRFMSADNLLNIVRQTTMISVMAVATVFVISAGEIDLSFAAIPALAGYIAALALRAGYGVLPAVALALAAGAVIGLVNGSITVGLRMPSFIVTLGMTGIIEGAARWITNRESVPIVDPVYTFIFGSGSVGPIPVLLLWTVGMGVIGHFLLKRTPFGKAVLATGGNSVAARYSGIRTDRIKVIVLVMSGVFGALAGLLYTGYLHNARYDLGEGDLLTVLAAVIIGGTALTGGRGSVIGAIFGSLLMGLINNGLILLGLDTPQQLVFRGAIIVIAVALSARGGAKQ